MPPIMKFALDTPHFGPYANPRTQAQLAREAEDAGWDGSSGTIFRWDGTTTWPIPGLRWPR